MAERLVLGAGPACWEAGTDLFLDVARRLLGDRDLAFVWVGRRSRSVSRCLDQDVTHLGLDGRVRWMEDVPADLQATVMMTPARTPQARRRAYDLAPEGVPVIAFSLIKDDPGYAEFPDTAALATVLHSVLAGETAS